MGLRRIALTVILLVSVPVLLCARPSIERLFSVREHKELPEAALSVHMASDQILVVSFTDSYHPESLPSNPLLSVPSDWLINGQHPIAVYHAARSVNELPKQGNSYPVEVGYSLYLELNEPLENHARYEIESPFGSHSFVFDDSVIFNESIKVNQVGYHPDSTVRYANLGVFLGDGGSRKVNEDLPYSVITEDGTMVYSGTVQYRGDDTITTEDTITSGEYVYRLDLSEVERGGPYRIYIAQWGVSHPFSISYEAVDQIATTALRGLYHQRCGTALELPYTPYERDACHTEVALTKTEWGQSTFIDVPKGTPMISITGGHHDAGDFDRRPYHTLVPIMLLSYLEAFPTHFLDAQASIPESGNGLPDFLDEALWAIQGWEALQITDPMDPDYGMVMAGTETSSHPEYGLVQADTDTLTYGTFAVDEQVSAFTAGMMAHASRLLLEYGEVWKARSAQLYERALLAWNALEAAQPTTSTMYAALQLYLTSSTIGENHNANVFHQRFRQEAEALLIEDGYWPEQYRPGNITATCHTFHFSSYLLTDRMVDDELSTALEELIFRQAEKGGYMGFDMDTALYPLGVSKSYGWGAATAQGRYADVHAFAFRLAKSEEEREKQFAILTQYADYALGLNPLGVSFVTGLGSEQPNSPLHLDSWPAIEKGLPPVPGIVLYGPTSGRSGAAYQLAVSDTLYPVWEEQPQQRRWADGWSLVNNNEFTIWETMVWNIAMYGAMNTHPINGR